MTIRDMDRRTLLKTGLMSAAAAGAATIANTASARACCGTGEIQKPLP